MKALVVGCGKVGSEIVRDLAATSEVSSVLVADANSENLARVRRLPKVKTKIANSNTAQRLMRDVDIVCGALPGRLGFQLLQQAVEAGRDIVDISYTSKDPFLLHHRALANHCTVVPQCGVAPGLTNMCVGDAARRLDRIVGVTILVGGLPQKPVPPLNYRLVFSLEDVINEYTRPVHIIKKGAQRIVEPLSGRGFLIFPGVGKLEYFLTDGLGTLPHSYPHVEEMRELTLRYPGHAEIMHTLRVLGYFDGVKRRVDSVEIEPKRLTIELLRPVLEGLPPEDLLALRVDVDGVYNRKRVLIRYQLLDKFDRRHSVSAMARTTAYPCTSTALLLGNGKISRKGVVPPENISETPDQFRFVLSRLRGRGIRLTTRMLTMGSRS